MTKKFAMQRNSTYEFSPVADLDAIALAVDQILSPDIVHSTRVLARFRLAL
jgi:hypothetical protein